MRVHHHSSDGGPLMSRSESGGARGSLGGGLGGLGALGGVRRGSSRPQDSIKGLKSWLSRNLLLLATLVGVLCGVLLGLSLRPLDLHDDWVLLLSYPGELFMRLLKLMILPLVIASLIAGTSRLNARMNGRIALRTLVYFALTSLLNAMLGIVLVLAIHPGDPLSFGEDGPPLDSRDTRDPRDRAQVMDGLLDLGRNLFADNLFQAAFQQVHTVYVPKEEPFSPTGPTAATTQAYPAVAALTASTASVEMKRALKYRDGTNTLGIIFFCLLFGTVLSTMGSKGKVVVDFFCTIYEVIMKMVSGIMWLTPVGVCSVICGKILAVDDLAVVMAQLAWFILTVVIGVLLYQLIIMQLIYYAFLRKNPFRFYANLFQSNLTAFATASTAAALPISMRTMDRLGVDPRVTRFVLPIGCAVNMDGTALFIAVATIFIAQMNYMTLGWGDLATVCLTATAASMSSASVPSAALVLLLMVLSTIGIPAGEASLLFAVDWFVDRVRTTNNCLGDLYAAAVVEHLSKAELESPDGEALNTAEFNGIGTFVEDGDADLEAAMEKGPSLHNGSIKK